MNSKMKKVLVNAAMAGMIAGAGLMVPAAGSASTPTEVGQNNCGGKDGCGGKSGDQAKGSERHACKGMNGCKGQGNCKSAHNDCKGKNACKGKGFLSIDKETCLKIEGGRLTPEAKEG